MKWGSAFLFFSQFSGSNVLNPFLFFTALKICYHSCWPFIFNKMNICFYLVYAKFYFCNLIHWKDMWWKLQVESFKLEGSVQCFLIISFKNHIKMYLQIFLCWNLSLSMFLGCSYFFTKSEADVLINSVLRQNTACKISIFWEILSGNIAQN